MTTPTFVTRSQAGLVTPKAQWTPWPSGQPSGRTGHWESSGGQPDHANCAAEWRAIQRFHMSGVYIDIAYNFGVCQHGVVFEGRPIQFQSAAQRGGNPLRISVCYMGGPLTPFTPAAKAAYRWAMDQRPGTTYAHRDEPTCQTSCAGDEISVWIHLGMVGGTLFPVPQPPKPSLPLPTGGIHHPVLREGNVGPAVMELQRKLNGVSGTHLALDGVFGRHTWNAVVFFQRFFKLDTDGIAGPKTWGMLDYCAALRHIH